MSDWQWLESTRQLQEKTFGFKFPLKDDDLADYITMNSTALIAELGEFLQEIGWKSWVTNRGWINRDAAIKELIDIGHFLANLAVVIDVTDEEWVKAYQSKQQLNIKRQENGYDGVSTKCPKCNRALDDYRTLNDSSVCECGERISER